MTHQPDHQRLLIVDFGSQVTQLIARRLRCLLYTSDAADDLLCVDLGGRRIIKKKKRDEPQPNIHNIQSNIHT